MNTLSGRANNHNKIIRVAEPTVSAPRPAGDPFPPPDREKILADCAAAFRVSVADIMGPRRTATIVLARQTAVTVMRLRRREKIQSIGRFMGCDHTNVCYAIKKVQARADVDLKFKNTFQSLLAGVVIPYSIPALHSHGKKFITKTRELPKKTGHVERKIELGLNILRRRVRPGQRLSLPHIAAYCDVSWQAIWQLEQKALKHLREELRRKLQLSYGEFAGLNASALLPPARGHHLADPPP